MTPVVYRKAFEENSCALELSLVPKMRPRTKHVNNVYHHLKGSIKCGRIFVPTSGIGITQVAKKISVARTISSSKKSNTNKHLVDHRGNIIGKDCIFNFIICWGNEIYSFLKFSSLIVIVGDIASIMFDELDELLKVR